MANSFFQFRQFTIHQERCAMKVGTDGTLLGAWASAPDKECCILDIGTGTGLIALMMAQRFPKASITAVDIDEDAVSQAKENVLASPFADRINVLHRDVTMMDDTEKYDSIVCNPPFFDHSLICPDQQRTGARHTVTLNYQQLTEATYSLLKSDGCFSVIIPSDYRSQIESEALLRGCFISRVCSIQTTPSKKPKRYMIEFTKLPVSEIITEKGVLNDFSQKRNSWYQQLTNEFYIK